MTYKDQALIIGGVNWEKLRNKNILLTGATGFIGKWLLKSFLLANQSFALNSRIYCLVRAADSLFPFIDRFDKSVVFIEDCDLRYPINFNFNNIDYIINAACPADNKFAQEKPFDLMDISFNGLKNILNNCINNDNIKGILNLSSGAVYGNQTNIFQLSEDYRGEVSIDNNYAQIKRFSEFIGELYYRDYNLPIKTARIFTVIGPEMNLNYNFASCQFINAYLSNKSIKLANKEIIRSFIYVIDVSIWLWNILLDGEVNKTYNVGSEEPVRLEQLARLVSDNIEIVENNFISNSGRLYVPNCTRSKTELGLKENYELKEMVEEILKYESINRKNYTNSKKV